jgi:predicted DNA-binding ribbon-helix-helix protein
MAKEWRSIRIEHETYLLLREVAQQRGITYSDLLDELLARESVRIFKETIYDQHTDSINDSSSDGITAAGHGDGE